ncbi:hypothetical protein K7W03_25470 [Sphingobium sp. PNB]|uniref:hypothetical protein n=1 Tax=Sphingobium sp. PNB TaxID=863934 RepID=UPI001CA39FF9|nr:hypothetical protein [Sphingobium sp. PNB]MCB4862936.1 hypothetical protein [Sphingobium sp. PNB]
MSMVEKRKPYIRIRPIDGAELRFMVAAEGWAMVRRKGCAPFLVAVTEWNSWDEKVAALDGEG